MKTTTATLAVASLLLPSVAAAQGGKEEVRLAKLEEIVVTAPKVEPKDFRPDAKTEALLAEIEKAGESDEQPK
ncbi:MAG: hypothetical protein FJX59_18415 [Alphaproteobacteria bacterium]|nr:hypothetical protein [Alphaproteobacteria bacterium]